LRIVLPLANIFLGVLLFHLGDLQVRGIVVANGGVLEEPLQDGAAKARYVHYALNAPAWVLVGDTRDKLWSQSTYWTGHDLHYFLAVAVMWFLIGLKLDRRSGGKSLALAAKKAPVNRILAWAYLLYGLFVCYALLSPPPHVLSLERLFLLSMKSVISLENGWWFLPLGLAWGSGLILAGAHGLVYRSASATTRAAGSA
jgi:hypothetical protein